MADRIAVMRDGAIVQLGTGAEIYRNPASRYVADFIGEANLLACRASGDGHVRLIPDGPSLPYRLDGPASSTITLMIRPGDVRVGATRADEDEIALAATLRNKVFVGATWRLYLTAPGGQEIAAEPGYSADAEHLEPGDATTVRWRREAARLLAD